MYLMKPYHSNSKMSRKSPSSTSTLTAVFQLIVFDEQHLTQAWTRFEPAIEDPNTNLTLWVSGAIIQYLVQHYDTEKKLTYESSVEKHHLFQMSGQGP